MKVSVSFVDSNNPDKKDNSFVSIGFAFSPYHCNFFKKLCTINLKLGNKRVYSSNYLYPFSEPGEQIDSTQKKYIKFYKNNTIKFENIINNAYLLYSLLLL